MQTGAQRRGLLFLLAFCFCHCHPSNCLSSAIAVDSYKRSWFQSVVVFFHAYLPTALPYNLHIPALAPGGPFLKVWAPALWARSFKLL